MIYVVNLNPYVDEFDGKELPGGKGVNVAKNLKSLGVDSKLFFFYGGATGRRLCELLEGHNFEGVRIEGETARTRIVPGALGTEKRSTPKPFVSSDELVALDSLVSHHIKPGDFVVYSGSLPDGISVDYYASQVKNFSSARVCVDTSNVAALRLSIDAGAFLVKPNRSEMDGLASNHALFALNTNIPFFVVSYDGDGAVLFSEPALHIRAPDVTIRCRVGAGDAMVAGLLYAIQNDFSRDDVLRFGVACGSSAVMNDGTGLNRSQVDKLYALLKK